MVVQHGSAAQGDERGKLPNDEPVAQYGHGRFGEAQLNEITLSRANRPSLQENHFGYRFCSSQVQVNS